MEIKKYDFIDEHTHINSLTHNDNFSIRFIANESMINISVNDKIYDVTFDKNPIVILAENNMLEKYLFLIKELKNTVNVPSIDRCAISLSFLLMSLSSQYDSAHLCDEDLDSIIGNHVIKNDSIKLESMKNIIETTDFQYLEKQQIHEQKKKLNTEYCNLLEKISLYQNQICSMYDNNICDGTKPLIHILKNNKNSIKTVKIFCETSYKLTKICPLNKREFICPRFFWKSIEIQIMDLIKNTKMFNVHNVHSQPIISRTKLLNYIQELQNIQLSDQLIKRIISLTLDDKSTQHIENLNIIMISSNIGKLINDSIDDENIYDDDIHVQVVQKMIKKYTFIQPNTMHQIVQYSIHNRRNIHNISDKLLKTHEIALLKNVAVKNEFDINILTRNQSQGTNISATVSVPLIKQGCTILTKLNALITEYVRKCIFDDKILSLQIMLLNDTIQYITNVLKITHINVKNGMSYPIEYHIKGGFCRDMILSYLSKACSNHNESPKTKLFEKSVKDIDIAMNFDPEIFTHYFCQIASTKYNIHPSKRWNNAEKNEKGKNISVWSVKLIPESEAIEFVHFRTDNYDPETGAVEATDAYESIVDDTRRDIPWPSFRLNDFVIIDYFNIIGMLNRGDFVVRTPPYRSELNDFDGINLDIIDAKINFHTHLESGERVLRMLKFVSPPFDSSFAFNFDIKTNKFKQVCNGFKIHESLIKLYQYPETDYEIQIRNQIHQYIRKWLDNNILSNVFKSIQSIICHQPDMFFHYMESFGLIDTLFDNNYCMEKVNMYTKTLKKLFSFSGIHFSLPYQTLGIGAKNKKLLFAQMKKLSLSNETQKMAEILMDYSDVFFAEKNNQLSKHDPLIISTFHQILVTGPCNIYLIELMAIMGLSIDQIDNHMIIERIKQKTEKTKIVKCVQLIMTDYMSMFFSTDPDNKHHQVNDLIIKNILNMISWILCTPINVNTVKSDVKQWKNNKNLTNAIGSIIKKKLIFSDNDNELTKTIIDFLVWFENTSKVHLNTIDNHRKIISHIVDYMGILCNRLNSVNSNMIDKIKYELNHGMLTHKQKFDNIHEMIMVQCPDFSEILNSQNINVINDAKILKKIELLIQ